MAGEQTVPEDVQDFLEQVDEISILVEGLKAGTISPEYVDGKLARKQAAAHSAVSTSNASKALPSSAHTRLCKVSDPDTIKRKEEEAVVQQEAEERRKEDVQRKVGTSRIWRTKQTYITNNAI